MCGIAGVVNFDGSPVDAQLIQRMCDSIRHRGPDDEGYLFADPEFGKCHEMSGVDTVDVIRGSYPRVSDEPVPRASVALGHRRLSIIDLSPSGHQPMSDEQGLRWIIYNGEIYNYKELRADLEGRGYRFRSTSDTEVLLKSYLEWGVRCVERLNGMFSFCVLDMPRKIIFLARDRFGIKPFYYFHDETRFLFASEIKAILKDPRVPSRPNEKILYDFLNHGRVDHDVETSFDGIVRLLPGHSMVVDLKTGKSDIHRWWTLADRCVDDRDVFIELLTDAVRIRLRSDVPVGSCLSGGLDSSAVVCLMTRLLDGKTDDIHTVSAVYGRGKRGDESAFIDTVVNHTGVNKHTIVPSPENLEKDLGALVWHQEEPFETTSIFAQWEVMRLAKSMGLKVLLDGQGADEQLGGYHYYFPMYFGYLLRTFRLRALARELMHHGRSYRDPRILKQSLFYALPRSLKHEKSRNQRILNKSFVKRNRDRFPPDYEGDLNEVLRTSIEKTLPALLRYEDRNSMAHSIETRLPFLDFRLVEHLASTPAESKISKGLTKVIMRDACSGIIPDAILNRKDKIGFATPEEDWFRGGLGSMVTSMLRSERMRERPYWNPDALEAEYRGFLSEKRGMRVIFRSICLEKWLETFMDP